MDLQSWLSYDILGNSVLAWGVAVLASAVAFIGLLIARRFIRNSLNRLAEKRTDGRIDVATAVVRKTNG